jgi:hypothetical protein
MPAKVSHLPYVRSVTSPYRSVGQISADGAIGFEHTPSPVVKRAHYTLPGM